MLHLQENNRLLKAILSAVFSLVTTVCFCQFSYNGSFEFERGDRLPKIWYFDTKGLFNVYLDSSVAFRGKKSLAIERTFDYDKKYSGLIYFQHLYFKNISFQRSMKVVQYIKSEAIDSVKVRMGISRTSCVPADLPDTSGSQTIEAVEKNGQTWYKVSSFTAYIANPCNDIVVIWTEFDSTSQLVHVDGFEVYLDDKLVEDIPIEKAQLPDDDDLQWMNTHAKNLDPGTGKHAYNTRFFSNEVGNAKVVALGEGTHGTKEFYGLRLELIKQLVKDKGFSVIVFEDQLETSLNINKALLTNKPAAEIADSMLGIMHRTKEVCEILDWVRAYNKTSSKKIQIAGADFQSHWSPLVILKAKVRDQQLLDSLDVIAGLHTNAQATIHFEELSVHSRNLLELYEQKVSSGKLKKDLLLQKLFEQLYHAHKRRVWAFEPEKSGNLRDSLMADNIIWLHEKHFKGQKMIVLSHNEHVTRGRNLENAALHYQPLRPMGGFLSNHFSDSYLSYGLFTGSGTVTGYNNYGMPAAFNLGPPFPGSYDYYFNKCIYPDFYLPIPGDPESGKPWKLFNNLEWRSVGFGGGGEYPFSYYNLADNFDGIFFIRNSSATRSMVTLKE